MDRYRKRMLIKSLRDEVPRVSFYRMVRSREFDELCRLYDGRVGIRSKDQFEDRARRLERTFLP